MDAKKTSKYAGYKAKGRKPVPAVGVSVNLSGPEGRRVVLDAARRVISTHSEVIKALAKR